jgi:hypothetical protein
MTTSSYSEHFRRGFVTRFNEHATQTEKQAMAAAAKALGQGAWQAGKNLFAKAPSVVGAAKTVGNAATGVGNAAAKTVGGVATNVGNFAKAHPVATGAATGTAIAGAGAAGAHNYYGQQSQNMLSEMPKAVSGFMQSQGAGSGVGGFFGKLMMLIQYLFGGQNANRNLAGSFANYAKSYPGFTGLNQQQFAKVAPTLTAPATPTAQ